MNCLNLLQCWTILLQKIEIILILNIVLETNNIIIINVFAIIELWQCFIRGQKWSCWSRLPVCQQKTLSVDVSCMGRKSTKALSCADSHFCRWIMRGQKSSFVDGSRSVGRKYLCSRVICGISTHESWCVVRNQFLSTFVTWAKRLYLPTCFIAWAFLPTQCQNAWTEAMLTLSAHVFLKIYQHFFGWA